MPTDIKIFYQEFFQEVQRDADVEARYAEDAFFEKFCEHLIAEGELDTADRALYYHATRGLRIDGYGGDPSASEGILSLIVADFSQTPELGRLTGTEMEAIFRRGTAFVAKALEPAFRRSLEETSAGFGLADLIAGSWEAVRKVKLILISNRLLSSRVDGRQAGEINGKPLVFSVWDIGRLHRYVSSGRSREDVLVDLDDFGGPLAALPAHLTDAGYESYLLVVPGEQLAAIYDRWGPRLLEQNVRVFLQARGGVNKGIRATIENDPEMFFAYNNGITATAEKVEGQIVRGQLQITSLRNLQIVNGGQTTASIYAASRKKQVDLSKIFVQMKLSVIPSSRAETVVPKISEYANSQNKVNAADFFANHPFHLRIKEFSQMLFAPSQDGTFHESKWFYERARGQYQDARGNLSVSERRKFDLEYPKGQVFSKTDLAKFANVWAELPHIVSKGAQKNFAHFAGIIGEAWKEQPNQFNEAYFRQSIAKAIVFRETEDIVTRQPWYEGGYRANIVAYAIAKMAHDVRARGCSVDFDSIWRAQTVSSGMRTALEIVARAVTEVLTDPSAGMKNVTEWAKQQACWSRVSALQVDWPAMWLGELLTADEQRQNARSAIRDQKVLNGIEAQTAVVNAGGDAWKEIRRWAAENRLLSEKELEILDVAGAIPIRLPTEKQCTVIMKALKKLRDEGCPFGAQIG